MTDNMRLLLVTAFLITLLAIIILASSLYETQTKVTELEREKMVILLAIESLPNEMSLEVYRKIKEIKQYEFIKP